MHKLHKYLMASVLIGLSFFVIRFTGIGNYLTIATFKDNKELLQEFVAHNYPLAAISYILFYAIAVALSFPAASLLTLVGGFFFGTFLGTVYANVGATTGAMVVFIAVRYLIGTELQKRYYRRLQRLNAAIDEHGVNYLLFLRLVSVVPFFVVNILAGLTRVTLFNFLWTTSLGIIPGSLIFSFAGNELEQIDSVRDIFTLDLLLALILLALLALLPIVAKRLVKKGA